MEGEWERKGEREGGEGKGERRGGGRGGRERERKGGERETNTSKALFDSYVGNGLILLVDWVGIVIHFSGHNLFNV